jgi:hypothetical protein
LIGEMSAKSRERTLVTSSLNHLVGAPNQCIGDNESKRLGGLQIQEQLNLCGLLNRQIAGLFALEDTGGVDAGQTVSIGNCSRSSSNRRPRRTRVS